MQNDVRILDWFFGRCCFFFLLFFLSRREHDCPILPTTRAPRILPSFSSSSSSSSRSVQRSTHGSVRDDEDNIAYFLSLLFSSHVSIRLICWLHSVTSMRLHNPIYSRKWTKIVMPISTFLFDLGKAPLSFAGISSCRRKAERVDVIRPLRARTYFSVRAVRETLEKVQCPRSFRTVMPQSPLVIDVQMRHGLSRGERTRVPVPSMT